jgi:hypothetical protein
MPQQNQATGKTKHFEKVFSVTLIPRNQAPKILERQIIFRFSGADGIASNHVRLVF